MKLSALFLLVGLFGLNANTSYSQKTISLDLNEVKVSHLLDIIESKTDFRFVYKLKDVDMNRKIRIKAKKEKIPVVLDKVFGNTQTGYKIFEKQIFLTERDQPLVAKSNSSITVVQQTITVSGTVTDSDNGIPIPGANISEQGTSNGVMSDFDGNYSIDVPKDATLEVSFVGFAKQQIEVDNRSEIDVAMVTETSSLDEVIVIGYGTQKKVNLTGAITQVSSEEFIEERPVTSFGQALQGVVPGLTVTKGNGTPGDGHSYNIRGTTSLNGGSPLILVDGAEMDPSLVPPEDVESVTVLKDAASAAIYGSRASFGVILITTKSGKKNHNPVFTYTGSVSVSKPTMFPDKVDPVTQIKIGGIQWENAGRTPGMYWGKNVQTWLDLYEEGTHLNSGKYVDGVWYPLGDNNDMLQHMTETSVSTKHNLSVTAGSENTTYYLSAGLMSNDGILKFDKDKYSRKNILSKIDSDINNWLSIGATVGFTRGIQTMPYIPNNAGYMYQVSYRRPTFWLTGFDEVSGAPWGYSPALIRLGAKNTKAEENTNIQGRVTVKPFEGFKLEGTYSFRNITGNDSYHVNKYAQANPAGGAGVTAFYRNNPNSLKKTASFRKYNILSITGEYTKSIAEKHNFKFMLGYSQESNRVSVFSAKRQKLISDEIPSLNLATGNQSVDDGYTEWATRSIFSRLNYNYKDKYLLEGILRYDGSSRFAEDNRFVYSPSASVGWIISKESFMAGAENWLNHFKIRASYGSLGNQNVGAYAYMSSMSTSSANWIIDGERPLYVSPGGLVSKSYTWEKVNSTNFGFDLRFLKNKLSVTAEIYKRETIGMLVSAAELPALMGTSAPKENSADLKVNGWELSMNWKDNLSEDFSYSFGLSIWDDVAEITKFDGNPTGQINNQYVGRKLGEIWGYETDRLFQAEDFVGAGSDRDYAPSIPTQDKLFSNRIPFPGDVKYADLNGDGVVDFGDNTLENHGDLKVIGNSSSRYQFGIRMGAQYKNFDLNIFMQGVAKKDLWTSSPFAFTSGQYRSVFSHTLDYWTPENTGAFYPRLDDRSYNKQTQSKYLLNAAYLRLKNIRLGYSLPKNIINKLGIGLKSVKIYATAENLFIWSGMPKGLDPELGASYTYPLRKDYAFGASISF